VLEEGTCWTDAVGLYSSASTGVHENRRVDLRNAETAAIAMRDLLTEETTETFDPADVALLTADGPSCAG
jgi:hypothetical protein